MVIMRALATTGCVLTMKKNRLFYPLFIWGLGASFFLIQYIVRISPSVMHFELMHAFSINAYQFGLLASLYYWAYILMQVPVGMLLDRYGTRFLLSSSIGLAVLGAVLFATTHNLYVADGSRFLMGFGSSFSFIGGIKLAKEWFDEKYFGVLSGATQGLGMFGGAFGNILTATIVVQLGWRSAIWMMALLYAVLGLLIFSFIRDNPQKGQSVTQKEKIPLLKSLSVVCKNRHTWINALYIGCMYVPSTAFAALWGVNFLERCYAVHREQAAILIGAFYVGWAVGAPALGWVSDRIGRRKPVLFSSALFSIAMLSVVLYLPIFHGAWLFILLFGYGFMNGGSTLSYAISSELNPVAVSGTAVALANMVSVGIGVVCQPLIGRILDVLWDGKIVNGVRYFTVHNFQLAFSTLMIALCTALVLSFFVKETYGKNIA